MSRSAWNGRQYQDANANWGADYARRNRGAVERENRRFHLDYLITLLISTIGSHSSWNIHEAPHGVPDSSSHQSRYPTIGSLSFSFLLSKRRVDNMSEQKHVAKAIYDKTKGAIYKAYVSQHKSTMPEGTIPLSYEDLLLSGQVTLFIGPVVISTFQNNTQNNHGPQLLFSVDYPEAELYRIGLTFTLSTKKF